VRHVSAGHPPLTRDRTQPRAPSAGTACGAVPARGAHTGAGALERLNQVTVNWLFAVERAAVRLRGHMAVAPISFLSVGPPLPVAPTPPTSADPADERPGTPHRPGHARDGEAGHHHAERRKPPPATSTHPRTRRPSRSQASTRVEITPQSGHPSSRSTACTTTRRPPSGRRLQGGTSALTAVLTIVFHLRCRPRQVRCPLH